MIAICAALIERNRTGRGQLVGSALFENNAWLVGTHIAQRTLTGQIPDPMPQRISAWGVYDVFATQDAEQIFVAVVSDSQWLAFCAAFDAPELLADQTLATNALRVASRPRLLPLLQQRFRGLTRDQIAATCEKAGLPFAPIRRPDDLLHDPHLKRPGAMVSLDLGGGERLTIPALPVEMSGRRFGRWREVPRLGEHSTEIAREAGYDEQTISALVDAGVIGLNSEP